MPSISPPIDIVIIDGSEETLVTHHAMLMSLGYSVLPMTSADGLTDLVEAWSPDCVLLDMFAPGADRPGLLNELCALPLGVAVIAMSGPVRGSIIVDAIKSGAIDFLEKPLDPTRLATCLRNNVPRFRHHREIPAPPPCSRGDRGLHLLTSRESEVLGQIAHGASSKEAGRNLGISPRTVDVHRAHIKKKLHAKRAIDLVRIVYDVND
jgi:two-component system, LuxR family, response regulator FixJ